MIPLPLKWAGGKSGLVTQLCEYLPKPGELAGGSYTEPFCGGASVFFWMAEMGRLDGITRVSLNDAQSAVTDVLWCLSDSWLVQHVTVRVKTLLDTWNGQGPEGRKALYESARAKRGGDIVTRAARMIFLNRVCFNGLWRVNQRGENNVPMGDYKTVNLPNLGTASLLLSSCKAQVTNLDFNMLFLGRPVGPGDFIYFDPPYHQTHSTFTAGGFDEKDHRNLARLFSNLEGQGARILLSNSDTPLIRELYEGYRIEELRGPRSLSRDGGGRGSVGELLILSERA